MAPRIKKAARAPILSTIVIAMCTLFFAHPRQAIAAPSHCAAELSLSSDLLGTLLAYWHHDTRNGASTWAKATKEYGSWRNNFLFANDSECTDRTVETGNVASTTYETLAVLNGTWRPTKDRLDRTLYTWIYEAPDHGRIPLPGFSASFFNSVTRRLIALYEANQFRLPDLQDDQCRALRAATQATEC